MQVENKVLIYPDDAMKQILKLYDYDARRMKEAVDILEEWIKKQTHFVKTDFPRVYLEKFILGNKGSIEKSKSKLDKLFTFRTLLPHFYDYEDIRREFRDMFLCSYLMPLPKLMDQLRRIYLVKLIGNDMFDKVPFLDYYKFAIASIEYANVHDCFDGLQVILDYRDVEVLRVISNLNVVEQKQFLTLLFEGYRARIKGIHIITASKTIELLLKIVKPVLSTKIANRFQVHTTLDSLYEVIPQDFLPKELGGTESTLDQIQSDWIETLCTKEAKELFREMKEARVNEAYRLNELNSEDMGLPGTFRSLSVD